MAHVSGPVSTLPGKKFYVNDGSKCDEHPEVDAVVMIQGETDSFGAEYYHLCQECLDEWNNKDDEDEDDFESPCNRCGTPSKKLIPRRDPDEGMFGPVYYICSECSEKQTERIMQELNEEDDYWD